VATRATVRLFVPRADAKLHKLRSRVVTIRTPRLEPGSRKVALKVSRKLRKIRATADVAFSDGTKLTKQVRIGS
jgi:hypothetical protein